ncbi:unnamed protein product [Chrysodeixis includens]|uniref:Folliculin n=1 Tax=Chrysodeixis includens TaxID=689277 RepID=A0A9P0BP12_CHRIL|nr:unnamed protein product [Chrysodeixis includens]
MNAIVGLCHFCEAHGPRPLFCTFTTDHEKHTTESSKSGVQCSGCTSLGPETVYVSREEDGTIYCSRETVPNPDVTSFLRQAAIRSITCEVNWSKEGGVVYFNDTHGHVLSLTFQLKDTWARGLKRWFSIVVLMKDKMLLLNLTPLLSEHMQKISKELQELAEVVFDAEQKTVIKTSNMDAATIIKGLSRLLPINIKDNPRLKQSKGEEHPPPIVCFLEETENSNFSIKWVGSLPAKCPTLMNRIETSMNNEKFSDDVLHQHIKSLQLEWLGIAKAVKGAVDSSGSKSDAVTKLKQVFGVAQHDEPLLNYWMSVFCS